MAIDALLFFRMRTLHTKLTVLFACFAVFEALPGVAAQSTAGPPSAEIEQLLTRAEEAGASGVLFIGSGDEWMIQTGFGSASCTGDDPVTPDHVFMIGSITKELTRVLAFVLEERKFLSLDDTLAKHLENVRGPVAQVTLHQLLNHTGGLPDLIDVAGRPVPYSVSYDYEPVSREQLIERASTVSLLSEPGSEERYSNLGYQLLAAAFEVATKRPFPELLREHLFVPAGMNVTDFWFPESEQRAFTDGCLSGGARWGNPIDDAMWSQSGPSSGPSWNLMGAGGLLSTAESLAMFFVAIIEDAFFKTQEQAQRYKESRLVYSQSRQQYVMAPAGSNGIFNAVGFLAVRDRFVAILMTNRADHPAEGGLFRELMELFPPKTSPLQD